MTIDHIYTFITLTKTNFFCESIPGLSESPLLIAQFWGSSHGRQQRHDGPSLLVKGHQKGLKYLREGKYFFSDKFIM